MSIELRIYCVLWIIAIPVLVTSLVYLFSATTRKEIYRCVAVKKKTFWDILGIVYALPGILLYHTHKKLLQFFKQYVKIKYSKFKQRYCYEPKHWKHNQRQPYIGMR